MGAPRLRITKIDLSFQTKKKLKEIIEEDTVIDHLLIKIIIIKK